MEDIVQPLPQDLATDGLPKVLGLNGGLHLDKSSTISDEHFKKAINIQISRSRSKKASGLKTNTTFSVLSSSLIE